MRWQVIVSCYGCPEDEISCNEDSPWYLRPNGLHGPDFFDTEEEAEQAADDDAGYGRFHEYELHCDRKFVRTL
jgi:hypothetical protein